MMDNDHYDDVDEVNVNDDDDDDDDDDEDDVACFTQETKRLRAERRSNRLRNVYNNGGRRKPQRTSFFG